MTKWPQAWRRVRLQWWARWAAALHLKMQLAMLYSLSKAHALKPLR